jgi:ElaB/YqjD/DUF883 family membrane-anchored ribosome-binding protein
MDTYTGSPKKPEEKEEQAIKKEKEDLASVNDAARKKVEQSKGKATEVLEEGKKQAASLEKEIEHFINDHPLSAVLVAAGLGLALGLTCRALR